MRVFAITAVILSLMVSSAICKPKASKKATEVIIRPLAISTTLYFNNDKGRLTAIMYPDLEVYGDKDIVIRKLVQMLLEQENTKESLNLRIQALEAILKANKGK